MDAAVGREQGKYYYEPERIGRMEVQILEFEYDGTNVTDIESQLNGYFSHQDVTDVQITTVDDRVLVFCFQE